MPMLQSRLQMCTGAQRPGGETRGQGVLTSQTTSESRPEDASEAPASLCPARK